MTRGGTLKVRAVCKRKETVVDAATLGLQGPAGPPGPSTGPAGGALSGSYPDPSLADGAVTAAAIAAGSVGPAQIGSIPAVLVYRSYSNPQTMPSGLYTAINRDTPIFDTADMYDPMHPERLTAPIDGLYAITANVVVNGANPPASYQSIDLATVGGTVLAEDIHSPLPASYRTPLRASALARLTAGTGVRVTLNHAQGTALGIDSNTYTNFSMVWVAPAP